MSAPDDYRAATGGLAWIDRSDRGRLEVGGRAPVRMLDGVLTGTMPRGLRAASPDVAEGRASYSAALTPKGRMVTDLRVLRTDAGADALRPSGGPVGAPAVLPGTGDEGQRLVLDVPVAGMEPLLAHLGRFLPPRFASVDDVTAGTGMLTVLGPGAPGWISREATGLRVEEHTLVELEEDELRAVGGGDDPLLVLRTGEVAAPAWDVLADRATVAALGRRLAGVGAVRLSRDTWTILRVEAGRPAFGADMDASTIPVEAGIAGRAIDHAKGCYTGQEVIVRIRDRGHVNRHLRGLRFDGEQPPEPGTELFAPEVWEDRPVGSVTTAVHSPRAGRALALGYVRREVEPGGRVRTGDGAAAEVVDLAGGSWG